jgi:ABC-type Zn uptake system ZnuABC Zn-binding protein ZnuA
VLRPPLVLAVVSLLLVLAGGCNSAIERDGSEVRVVASTGLIAEFASTVAGDDAIVVGLIPAGVDPHSFEPAPAIAAAIAQADLILVNGYNLEEGLLDVVEQNASNESVLIAVSAGIDVDEHTHDDDAEDGHGHDEEAEVDHAALSRAEGDPHLWLDVRHAMRYVENIRDTLIELDPAHGDGYEERAAGYLAELQALDDRLVAQISDIAEGDRELVVFHDAFQYFARAYSLELVAAVLPAGAQQDPSAGALVELIETIEAREVRVVFAEPQFSSTVLERIASEAGVEVGTLYSVYAGEVDTYIEMMEANGDALAERAGS